MKGATDQADDLWAADPMREWLRRVRLGVLVLFWTFLLSPLLSNLFMFVLLLVSRDLGYLRWIGWIRLIQIVAGVPMLIGVWALTVPPPPNGACGVSHIRRCLLRVLVWLDLLKRIVETIVRLTEDSTGVSHVWSAIFLFFDVVCVLCGLLFLRHLCRQLLLDRPARSFGLLIGGYLGLRLLDLVGEVFELAEVWPVGWSVTYVVLGPLFWVWGLAALRGFAGRLKLIIEGRCAHCGYLLKGLPEPRCPECGRVFLLPAIQ